MIPWQAGHELRDAIRAKKLSPTEVARACLDRISALDARVKAFVTVTAEAAMAQARRVEEKIAKGQAFGALAGVPVALKDNLCTTDAPTTCSSRILKGYTPPYDATVVARLRAADAVIVGKTNLDEFAMGSSTENSALFTTRNPWDLERVPGGSSGGSAAAVAAGFAPLALGSDTGGSIRQPAALTGTVGLKPTYGRVSRYGLVAFASSLDQIGPITRDVRDAAMLMDVIAGPDPLDSTSAAVVSAPFEANLERSVAGLRVGIPKEYFGEGLDPEVRTLVMEAVQQLEGAGARVSSVSLPTTKHGIAAYYIVAPCEASSNLARYDGVHYGHRAAGAGEIVALYARSRKEGFGPEVTRRILLGTFALSSGYVEAYYVRALKARRLIKEDFDRAFAHVDVIVGPTSPTAAFKAGEKAADPLAMYLCDVYTVTANLAGLPGVSVPCGFTKAGLPVGLQVLGRAFDDLGVLQAAFAVEKLAGVTRRPAL
jgi:aspartyl-tRNA(Asn)/glutamyl-tRNA(Gln) amidotransferase subunit A